MKSWHKVSRVLAAGTAALALTSAVGVSTAAAEEKPGEQCISSKAFKAEGSSLQKVAQEKVWGPGFNTNAEGCNGSRGKKLKPTVTYTPDGSGAGLEAYGVNGKSSPEKSKDIFIGSDEAPEATELKEIDKAANGAGEAGQAVVVPVLQAAIAVIANPPVGCKISKISNADLQNVFNGKILKWSEISTAEKIAACEVAIKRVVRFDASGTTHVFKQYLAEINKEKLCDGKTWTELAKIENNLKWPESEKETCGKLSPLERPAMKGGAEEVKKVAETESSIGYANLADARAQEAKKQYTWLAVQNEKYAEAGEQYAHGFPGKTAGEPKLGEKNASESNCEGAEYTNIPTEKKVDDNWSAVQGAHPSTNENYPICTLTYDVGLKNYFLAKVAPTEAEAHEYGQTAYDYLKYVSAAKGGQEEINKKHDYLNVEKVVKTYAQEEVEKFIN